MSTINGLDLVGCTVSDVPASVAFYRDTLGLVPNMVHEQGAEFIFPDGTTLGLWNPGDGTPPGFGVMFAVDDIRAAIDTFRKRGLEISDPNESSVCFMAFAQDPDGNTIIVHQRKEKDATPAPAYEKTATSVNGIDVASYYVSDPERAVAFYRDVLGMTPTALWEGRGGEFTLADGSTFGLWKPDPGRPIPGGAIMFAVQDAAAASAKLREKGVTISDAMELPSCNLAVTTDPDNIGVIMHQRKA